MSRRIRVAIAGTGFIGAVHARSARLAGARLVEMVGRADVEAAPDGLPGFADGLRAARLTDAVLASAREERWVELTTAIVEPA